MNILQFVLFLLATVTVYVNGFNIVDEMTGESFQPSSACILYEVPLKKGRQMKPGSTIDRIDQYQVSKLDLTRNGIYFEECKFFKDLITKTKKTYGM